MTVVFLDRDGVIIENRDHYIRSWDDVYIYPWAIKALKKFSHHQFVIVTNQSAIGRGIITYQKAQEINRKLIDTLQTYTGYRISNIYMCPHTPNDNCECRKPKAGMLKQAAIDLEIDLSQSVMIGDALTDLQAGWNAGVKQCILVKTGRGKYQRIKNAIFCDNLLDALYRV